MQQSARTDAMTKAGIAELREFFPDVPIMPAQMMSVYAAMRAAAQKYDGKPE